MHNCGSVLAAFVGHRRQPHRGPSICQHGVLAENHLCQEAFQEGIPYQLYKGAGAVTAVRQMIIDDWI